FTETDARRPGCVTRAAPSTVRPPSLGHLQRHRGDDDAIVVGVNVLARAEGNATEGHRHVTVTEAALFGLHRVAGQSLNNQRSLDQNIYITHSAVDDDAFPAIVGRLLCQHVAQQGAAHGAAAIHHHDLASAIDRKSTRLNSSHVKISYAVF